MRKVILPENFRLISVDLGEVVAGQLRCIILSHEIATTDE